MGYMRDLLGRRLDSFPVFDAKTMTFTRTATVPAGLGWPSANPLTPTLVETLKGEMTGSCGYTPEQLFDRFSPARSNPTLTLYVNRTSGLDTNNGTSAGTAFQTLLKAVQTANAAGVPTLVYVEYGDYERATSWQGTSPTVDIAFVGRDGGVLGGRPVRTGTWDLVASFTADATYTSTYSKAVANCTRVFDRLAADQYLNSAELRLVSSPAICNTNPGTWHCDGTKLYIHRADNAAVTDANTRYFRDAPGLVVQQQVNVYLDGFDVQGSGSAYNVLHVNSPATTTPVTLNAVVTKNCTFRYGGSIAGGNGKGVAAVNWYGYIANFGTRCDANADDAFGIHNLQAGPAYMLNVNCQGRDNGRLHQSVNGFTLHESCVGVDIAGSYEFTRGGTVHNIENSKAYLLGTTAGNDQGDQAAGGSIPAVAIRAVNSAEIWAERVVARMPAGQLCYQAVNPTSKIHRRDCAPVQRGDAGDGVFDTF